MNNGIYQKANKKVIHTFIRIVIVNSNDLRRKREKLKNCCCCVRMCESSKCTNSLFRMGFVPFRCNSWAPSPVNFDHLVQLVPMVRPIAFVDDRNFDYHHLRVVAAVMVAIVILVCEDVF